MGGCNRLKEFMWDNFDTSKTVLKVNMKIGDYRSMNNQDDLMQCDSMLE